MSKKDLIFSTMTGLITGLITWRLALFLKIPEFRNISFAWLIVFVPLLWIAGVKLGYILGTKKDFFNQFGKFSAVGFTNAAVDFGVLNLLIFYTGIASGIFFSVFKTTSFLVSLFNSYFWNKFWAFDAGKSQGGWNEFARFVGVILLALLVNVSVASVVVNFINPVGGLSPEAWANVGAIAGSAAALLFSFAGFRSIVFTKQQ